MTRLFSISRRAARAAALFIPLCLLAAPVSAQLRISEFMASNVTVTQDEDGAYSDWIEIYNSSNAAVDLNGWHLTDSATNLTRWTFPATNLPAGGYLLVFASGKNRTTFPLHANFSLDADGEYLALVRPDGTTVEQVYTNYPEQFADISYGLQTSGTNPTLRAGQPGFLIYHTPCTANTCVPAPHPLYSDDSVAQVDLTISQSGWDTLMYDPWNESYQTVSVRFRHGNIDLTVTNAGIQCRGNTSREKQPRSFNIAFDAFVPGQKLLGLERLNLNGDVNDPSRARPKLLNDLHNAAGLPTSYANHAAVVVHGPNYDRGNWVGGVFFDAVRNNTQPVDDNFLEQRFDTSRGNLYKCNNRTWQATLEYRGDTGSAYIGDGTTYELKYAGGGDTSYSDFAAFVALINNTSSNDFPNAIMNAFDVDVFLKRSALDVLTGNWDDYYSNANNYHLFLNPETRRWVYIPYDFDNSSGIHWDSVDWANRNIYSWENFSGSTPLATRIFGVTEFRNRYTYYLKQMLGTIYTNTALDPALFHYRATLTNTLPFQDSVSVTNMLARERQRYNGDYPYTSYDQFYWSYVEAQNPYNGNLADSYGVSNFISARASSARSQLNVQNIGPILSDFTMTPSLPHSNDAVQVSIRAVDDVSVTNVSFFYTFRGGATNTAAMTLQTDGTYAATLPAFGGTGTVRYLVCAYDNTGKTTTQPYGGAAYAATVEVESAAFNLVVTELNYNPYALSVAESNAGVTDAQNLEFVELYNAGSTPLNLTGYKLQDGITATFPAFILTNGTYAVVVKNTNQFRLRYTNSAIRVIGTVFSGNLSNGGETVRLENAGGGVIAAITYSDSGDWPGRADGDGSSLELCDPAVPAYSNAAAWRASSEYGGSPGAAGLGPDNRVVVNEVLSHTDPPLSDSVELFNTTEGAINIGGWFLSDSKSNYRKYRIPAGTILSAGGYAVYDETNNFNISGNTNLDFSFDGAHGDDVYLVQADAQSNLVRFVDHVEFGAAANGESFGRWPNGSGGGYPMLSRTFGSANSGPRVGPLFLSEIMYNPPSASNHLEFIEIANPTGASVDLTNWQIDEGVTFAFSAGTSIPAGGALAVLSFDPNAASNSALLASFLSTYALSNANHLVGPWSGVLDNGGETVRLLRPDEPPAEEPAYYPMLLEDAAAYDDDAPWPLAAAGGGSSLERLTPAAWGDDSANWTAQPIPTPGVNGEPVPTFNLVVVSDHGSPAPAVGSHAYATNSALSNSVPSPVVSGGSRYLCTGWTLAGGTPATGATNWMTMALTNDATLTWLWNTNFMLTTGADAGGSVQPASDWQTPGAVVALEAVPSNLFAFASWTGDTNAIVSGSATSAAVSVRLDTPITLVAHFSAITPTYYVSPSGSHSAPFITWETAATSLQAIVDYVPDASTVLVAAATYVLPEQLTLGRPLVLRSSGGPAATILDGGNATRILYITNAAVTVEGFTIQRGNSGASSGGGVRIEPAGRLANCIVRSNTTQKSGGGATLLNGGEIRNCLFSGNSAGSERGGGVYAYTESSTPLIESCTFAANTASEGGGVYLLNSATLRNSIVWGNTASSGSNIVLSGYGQTIQNTDSGPTQSGSGNLGSNPRFLATDDFRLATNSPCIDIATNQTWMSAATDLDGRPRVIHTRADIGAFEAILPAWDSDADGLPDWWEWDNSQTLEGMTPSGRSDSDRFSDYEEYLAGTDPCNGASFLGIEAAVKGTVQTNTFVLRWSSATGRTYRITCATNMVTNFSVRAYTNISAQPPANTFTGSLSQPGGAFYRIELE